MLPPEYVCYDSLLALQMRKIMQGRSYAALALSVRYSYLKKIKQKTEQTKLIDMESKGSSSRSSKGKKTSAACVYTHTHTCMYYIHNKIYEK